MLAKTQQIDGVAKCPVCRGSGKVKTKDGKKKQACLQCRGTGQSSPGYRTKVPAHSLRK